MGKDNRPPKHLRTLKYGDVREDGMIFRGYNTSSRNGERWITPAMFDEMKLKQRNYRERRKKDNRPPKNLRTLKIGDVREDGMVFWQYSPEYKNGEIWMDRDKFEVKRLAHNLRSRIGSAIKHCYGEKSTSTMKLLGCTVNEVRDHIESQFTEGMTWDNYGEWHIDHIKPCASFDLTIDEEQKKCFHYSNLQPLWAEDNIRKSDK